MNLFQPPGSCTVPSGNGLDPPPGWSAPTGVERLVVNLLTNAVRHNVVDGNVEIMTGVRDGGAFVSVTNTGPVIPPTEVERLFQPFQRLDPGRANHKDGHGLGLSIVRAIATAHGATITARPVRAGGVSLEVAFPPPAHHSRPAVLETAAAQ